MTTQAPHPIPADEPNAYGYLALVLAWIVPGLGHLILGERARAVTFAITIHALFALGMLIGGIRAINPPEQQIWGYTQWLVGWPRVATYNLEKQKSAEYQKLLEQTYPAGRPDPNDESRAAIKQRKDYGKEFLKDHPIFAYHPKIQDIGAVYCGIAGMLNLLVMFDVLLRITGSEREVQSKKKREAAGATATPLPAPEAAPSSPAAGEA